MATQLPTQVHHGISRALHKYADWRISATEAEKRCHKHSDSVLLTFDDYGTESEVKELLAILADKQTKAMFFLVGSWAAEHPKLVEEIRNAGHIIGNHTATHANLLKLSDDGIAKEIAGGLSSKWLRAPEGRYNRHVRQIANRLGFSLCYWTIDSRDWTTISARAMRHTILTELHPGAVILFHIHGGLTRQLLPSLIDEIRSRGYTVTNSNETW